jgi:hypothetical protein
LLIKWSKYSSFISTIGPGHFWTHYALTSSQFTCMRFYSFNALASTARVRWATRAIEAVDAELPYDSCSPSILRMVMSLRGRSKGDNTVLLSIPSSNEPSALNASHLIAAYAMILKPQRFVAKRLKPPFTPGRLNAARLVLLDLLDHLAELYGISFRDEAKEFIATGALAEYKLQGRTLLWDRYQDLHKLSTETSDAASRKRKASKAGESTHLPQRPKGDGSDEDP